MIDFRFYKPFVMKQNTEGPKTSFMGSEIKVGDFYIEEPIGEETIRIYALSEKTPLDFFGDLSFVDGDFAIIKDEELDIQDVYIRAISNTYDFKDFPTIGANLSDFRGQFNTEETGLRAMIQLQNALDQDRRFENTNFDIDVFPVDHETIMFTIAFDDQEIIVPLEL